MNPTAASKSGRIRPSKDRSMNPFKNPFSVIAFGCLSKRAVKAAAAIALVLFSQCATALSIPSWLKKNSAVFYSGTRCDVTLLIENDSGKFDPVYLIDLPFSFALDTVLSPFTLILAISTARYHKEIGFSPPCTE